MQRLRVHYERAGQADVSDLVANLKSLLVEAEEIFIRRGIDPIEELAEKLNRQMQKAVQVITTSDRDEDMVVVERVKRGFALGDSAFRKEEVVVKKYSPQGTPAEESATERDPLPPPD